VHFSDAVPERFKGKAQRIDTKQFELSETQRADAAARADGEQAAQAEAAAKRAPQAATAASAPPAGSSASTPAAPIPTTCEALWQRYRQSQECFAPYQRRERGTDPEAFKHCEVFENPSQKCGPPKW
jgi:hypothetical protein